MPTVYLDYNIIVKSAGSPAAPYEDAWQKACIALLDAGYRIVLSAWHAYEMAKSENPHHLDACCAFIEQLNPLWLSNNNFVKHEEIARFLKCARGKGERQVRVFNQTVSQMWATYGGIVLIGETFAGTVAALRSTPGAINEINTAAAETPGAIRAAREAQEKGYDFDANPIFDREYFGAFIDPADQVGLEYVMNHRNEVYASCQAIAVDDILTRIRVSDKFGPKAADAADLQHALAALAYCDYFVSDDKRLVRHCGEAVKRCGLACSVHRNPTTITP